MNRVFREEKKFLIGRDEFIQKSHTLSQVMLEDAHNGTHGYIIRSLYFDTVYDTDCFEKLAGVETRRKIRLRVYDPAADYAMLEMKQKQGASQLKRSLRVSREDAIALTKGGLPAAAVLCGAVCRRVLCADAVPLLPPENDRAVQPKGVYRQGEQDSGDVRQQY